MLIADGHLDLAWNALQWNRNLLDSVYTIRACESRRSEPGRALGTVALPQLREGRIALCFATMLARSTGHPTPHLDYATPFQSYGIAHSQLAYYRALERAGDIRVFASHSNCRVLVPHQRQFSDDQIRAIIERDGVIGVVLDAWMLKPGWIIGRDDNFAEPRVTLSSLVDHIDHICFIAGDTAHVAIGSDLDGGFGRE